MAISLDHYEPLTNLTLPARHVVGWRVKAYAGGRELWGNLVAILGANAVVVFDDPLTPELVPKARVQVSMATFNFAKRTLERDAELKGLLDDLEQLRIKLAYRDQRGRRLKAVEVVEHG